MSRINEPEYLTIKQLLAKGYEGGKVAEIVGRGRGVVSRINTSTSYEEFVERGKAVRARYKKPAAPKSQQLPLGVKEERPKTTSYDLARGIVDKLADLRDDLELYAQAPVNGGREKRDAKMALLKLEEAGMWLTHRW